MARVLCLQEIQTDEQETRRKREATALAKLEEAREANKRAKKNTLKQGKRARTSAGSVFQAWSSPA